MGAGSLISVMAGNRNRTRGQSLVASVREPRTATKLVAYSLKRLGPTNLNKLKR